MLRQWSLWNNLYSAQRRLLRKERQADGKVKRHHEKQASTPCQRLLACSDLSTIERERLQRQLREHDPIELRASIESKLRALYAKRAQLQAQDEAETASPTALQERQEGAAPARGKAGLRSIRSVAYGSQRSLRSGQPSRVRRPGAKGELQNQHPAPRTQPITVSPIVRHRATS